MRFPRQLLTCLIAICFLPVANALTVFQDDFEDGTWEDKWTLLDPSYSIEVTDADAANGTTYSLHTYGWSSPFRHHCDGLVTTFDAAQPSYISFYSKIDQSRNRYTDYFVIGDDDIHNNLGIIFFYCSQDEEYFKVWAGSPYYYYVSVGDWHFVEFRDLNWTDHTMDWYVDGTLAHENIPYRSTATVSVTQLHLYSISNSSEYSHGWYDEIYVGDGVFTEIQPSTFELAQNYPNPFNPGTTIEFSIQEPSDVQLAVFDFSGAQVATLVDGPVAVGQHSVHFDAFQLPSGIYIYQLTSGGITDSKKMVYVK